MTPEKKLVIKIGDEARTLVMSYAMLGELLRFVAGFDPNAIGLLITDLVARDLVIRRLLTDLQRPIEGEHELINLFDVDIEPEEIDNMLGWVVAHFTSFFLRSLKLVEKAGQNLPSPPATA